MSIFIFVIGACLGSFYLVVGKRMPLGKNAVTGRSKCDHCNHVLSWWQLIPIVSFIILRGKCHYCHKKISVVNIIMEIVTGLLFLFAYLHYQNMADIFMFMIISSLMLLIFVSDFSYLIILDSPLIIGSILIIIVRIVFYGFDGLYLYLISGVVLFVTMYLIKLLGDVIFKKESLGGGDIKFAFVIGLAVGFRLGLCTLILSTFLALPYSVAALMLKKNNEVPYGPFLASSLFIVYLFIDKFVMLLNVIFASL